MNARILSAGSGDELLDALDLQRTAVVKLMSELDAARSGCCPDVDFCAAALMQLSAAIVTIEKLTQGAPEANPRPDRALGLRIAPANGQGSEP